MGKAVDVAKVLAAAQSLYGKDKDAAKIMATGNALYRPTKPEEFIVAPEGHVWRRLTGLMGIPFGYIIQVAGAPDSGKSTIAMEFMVWAQQQGVYVILLDVEKKFDSSRFIKMGGDPAKLLIIQTTAIRKGAGAIQKFIHAIKATDPGAKILAVHDSVGGSISRARAEKAIDDEKDKQPGAEAVENSDYMKTMVAMLDKYPGSISLFLLNQMTDKIGFGQKGQSRSGGHKITFFCSIIIEMKQIKVVTKKIAKVEVKTGIISQAKVFKTHLGQDENSVYKLNVQVDSKGWHETDFTFEKPEDAEEAA